MSTPQLDYRETQFGIRTPDGEIRPVSIGPAEAERYRQAGVDLHSRTREVYLPSVTEWREVAAPTTSDPS